MTSIAFYLGHAEAFLRAGDRCGGRDGGCLGTGQAITVAVLRKTLGATSLNELASLSWQPNYAVPMRAHCDIKGTLISGASDIFPVH